MLPVLNDGGVAIIDELEADLHPHMLEAVIDLFVRASITPAIKDHEDTSDCWNQAIFGEMIPCLIRALIQRGAFFLTLIAS